MKKSSGPYVEKSTCAKRSRKHEGKCPIDMGNCYGCGKSGHMKRDFPIMKDQGREIYHAQARDPNPDAPKKNHFYALFSRSDQEECPDVVTGCIYHVVRVKDLESEVPPLESVPIVRDFPKVFPNDLPGVPPEWEIDFGIDLLPGMKPILVPPSCMALAELQ
ncbi:uncharacterized protein [Solanum lycopersicum]|uniref:uncharacterized protein n=1 Tax=Solanum lycopersicum TaxID=4081 RepID=UPI000532B4AD|nr:uncharacterized protein LOC104649293 [Solanum lycopersicum]